MEKSLQTQGNKLVVGVDEAGRGAWAGPVVAAAVIWPERSPGNFGINDSKQLTPQMREQLFEIIMESAVAVGVGMADVKEIDQMGVGKATYLAMHRAVDDLQVKPDFILVDGYKVSFSQAESQGIIKGDSKSISIAAASIVAKVTRDRFMSQLHNKNPRYGFALHKGYGTKVHQERLAVYGVSSLHRKSFAPIRLLQAANLRQGELEESGLTAPEL